MVPHEPLKPEANSLPRQRAAALTKRIQFASGVIEKRHKKIAEWGALFTGDKAAVLEAAAREENRQVVGMMGIGIAKIASEQN